MKSIHEVGSSFSLDKFLKARELTKQVVEKIQESVFVGMSEPDGHKIIDNVLESMGAEKKWHPNKFRIGKNTIKSFRSESDQSITLKENDLYFIDIGPVWDNHEGDYGDTFVFGNNSDYKEIAKASREVFKKTRALWQEQNLSGVKLYEKAQELAQDLGYELNTRMKGHRVGDFPHHLFYRGGMLESDEVPCNNLWILEIHLLARDGEYGSFFEDILQR